MKNLGFAGLAIAALAVTGCGGGGSSPATPASVSATASPAPPAAPGALAVAWTNAGPVDPLPVPGPQVLNSNGGSAAPPAASLAPGQSLTFAASQSGNTAGYTAVLAGAGCAAPTVNLSAGTSTTGAFTVASTAAAAPATCTLTVTGATGTAAVATTFTVLTEGAITLLWTPPGLSNQTSPPYAGTPGPIALIGTGTYLAATLYASEANFIGSYTATVTCTVPAVGIVVATVGGVGAATATSATGAFSVSANTGAAGPCSIGVTDANGKAAAPSIGATLTTTGAIVN